MGLLLFLLVIGLQFLLLFLYHNRRRSRILQKISQLDGLSNPTYEACKIMGAIIITRDYSQGLFFYLISPLYEDILNVFPPSIPGCVTALRWSPEGTQFLAYAALIIHLLGPENGSLFVHESIEKNLRVSLQRQRDTENLLKCIQKQLKVQSRAHDSRVVRPKAKELFGSVEREIVIETSRSGEVNFELNWTNIRITGEGTLGRFRVKTFPGAQA